MSKRDPKYSGWPSPEDTKPVPAVETEKKRGKVKPPKPDDDQPVIDGDSDAN